MAEFAVFRQFLTIWLLQNALRREKYRGDLIFQAFFTKLAIDIHQWFVK